MQSTTVWRQLTNAVQTVFAKTARPLNFLICKYSKTDEIYGRTIDCFELFSETPTGAMNKVLTYSKYKHPKLVARWHHNDGSFKIEEEVALYQAKLVISNFTRGKKQLHQLEAEHTRKVASVRIHVEGWYGS